MPSVSLQERAKRQSRQVRRTILASSVSSSGDTERSTLVVHESWYGMSARNSGGRHLLRCSDESHSKTRLEMPFDVTMEHPCAWIVGDEAQRHARTRLDLYCVPSNRVRLALGHRWIECWIIRRIIRCTVNDLKLMSVEMAITQAMSGTSW